VCPLHDIVIGLVLRYADTETKARHLTPSTLPVLPGPHALPAVDQPGWHAAPKLSSLPIVSLLSLAAESTDWNPAEQVCQRLRERSLAFTVLA
jgi:hypothetical protein